MAYAAPFILYYVLIILCQRYFTWLYVLDPREWICAEKPWVGGLWGTLALLLELTGLCGAWFALTAKRRLAGI